MMRLKTFILLLSLIMAFSLSTCAGGDESGAENVFVSETVRIENMPSDDLPGRRRISVSA